MEDFLSAKKREIYDSITGNLGCFCSLVNPRTKKKKMEEGEGGRRGGKRETPFLGLMNQVINSTF